MNEPSASSRKIIVAVVMAVVVGIGAVTFALHSPDSTPVAQNAAVPGSIPQIPDATPSVAQTPDVPVSAAQRDRMGGTAGDTAVPPAGDTNPPAAEPAPAPIEPKATGDRPVTKAHAGAGNGITRRAPTPGGEPVASSSAPVASSTDPVASDIRITTAVKSEIAADGSQDANVGVTTTNGVVVLTGTLATQDAIDHLKGVAEKVQDVKSVDTSALKITST